MPTKARIPLPSVLDPLTTKCVRFNVPDDPEWLGMFWGALYNLSVWTAYERSGNTDAADVASVWRQVIADARSGNCGSHTDWGLRQNPVDGCDVGFGTSSEFWEVSCSGEDCFVAYAGQKTVHHADSLGVSLEGYLFSDDSPAGGHVCNVHARVHGSVLGMVWQFSYVNCLGELTTETIGGESFDRGGFDAKQICILSPEPFSFSVSISGEHLCTVA